MLKKDLPKVTVNHKFYKNLAFLFIFLLTVTSTNSLVMAQESRLLDGTVYVDNLPIETEYALRDGHMMVPALFLKNTGAKVDWNHEYQSIVFHLGTTHVAVSPDKISMDFTTGATDWQSENLPTKPISADGQTFIPLKYVAEKLGLEFTYDPEKKQTSIQNPSERKAMRIGSGSSEKMQVALTFDDGPDATYTPQILEILQEKGVPATFFVVGKQIEEYPEMMKRIVDEGHALGNHSFTHAQFPNITTSGVLQELRNTQLAIDRVVGRKPDLFRPPYGAITRADEELAHDKGFRIVTWSVDTLDWTGVSGNEIFSIVQQEIQPGGIILQHNIDANPGMLDGTVEALPLIIDDLHAKGYSFVTVQTLLEGE